MIVLLLVLTALVAYAAIRATFSHAPDVVIWFLFALLAGLCWLLYLNFDDLVALWIGIKNLPGAVTAFLTNTRDEIRAAMTGWAWVACALFLGSGTAIGGAASWVSGRALRAVQVGRLKRELEQAREEIKREREKAGQAEQAAARDRETAELAESRMESAERRSQGLEGQLASAVSLADDRGLQLSKIREKKRAEKGQRPEGEDQLPKKPEAKGRKGRLPKK